MHGIIHPFSKALYEQDGAGHIKVSLDGKWGLFNIDGSYIEGEIRGCDPQLCGWVGGPQIANHRVAAPALERQ
ncbi:MAG: hypothetical protein F2780_06020 [Actinobacteria bacterium]|jgi:hypothetical protein|uniref:Unannotated protein n=1 Tax=freshwater metagenome TaxID=449393 RepID=A0A6J7DUV4_9ZZZZ|nr:hypothetical protein [Actinomycetota bacterium]